MLELVIPLTAIALLFVAWALCAAGANAERASDAEPDEAPDNWNWPAR
jgi:hypothetical protein